MTFWHLVGINAVIGEKLSHFINNLLSTAEEVTEVAEATSNGAETMSVITETASAATEAMSVIAEMASVAETVSTINETAVAFIPDVVSNISTLAFSNASDIVPTITNVTSVAADAASNFTSPEGLGDFVSQFDIETAYELATEYSPLVVGALAITGTIALSAAAVWKFCFAGKAQQQPSEPSIEDSSQRVVTLIERYQRVTGSAHIAGSTPSTPGTSSGASSSVVGSFDSEPEEEVVYVSAQQLPMTTIYISYLNYCRAAAAAGTAYQGFNIGGRNYTWVDHIHHQQASPLKQTVESTIQKALGLMDDNGDPLSVSAARAEEIRSTFGPS